MPRQIGDMEDLIQGKIRKRGCSPSASSSSSIIQNYRLKKAVLVGKRGGSSTPVPTWRLMSSRSPSAAMRGVDSPKYSASLSGRSKAQAPVSARKLAATLWEMNEMPSPRVNDELVDRRLRKESKGRDRIPKSMHSGPFPPHLSDPSHSPGSERSDRSGIGRRAPSISQKLRLPAESARVSNSLSNASLMEVETRSRAQTPCGSTLGVKIRLKDVSNALITSKELLKIINRIWGHEDRPSSNMSLISALHSELERARLLVNQLIQEQRSDQNEINYLMKCFAEEKAAWKNKEREVVESAIESAVVELEVERKLRRRSESLSKKLGRELADAKTCLVKTLKELESEKRAREIIEEVCDDLVADIEEEDNKDKVEDLKVHENNRQLLISEDKNVPNEKNDAIDTLRRQLEAFLGTKKDKEKGSRSLYSYGNNEEASDYFNRVTHFEEEDEEEEDTGEVVDRLEYRERSVDSDLHSIELEMGNSNKKSFKWGHHHHHLDEEVKARKSTSFSRRNSLQRSTSDGVELCGAHNQFDFERSHLDELQGHKTGKGGFMDRLLLGTLGSPKAFASPTRQPRPSVRPGSSGKSRLSDARTESMSRKSKR